MEKEFLYEDSPATQPSLTSGEDSDPTLGPRGKPNKSRSRPNKKFTKKKSTPRPEKRVKKVSEYLKSLEVGLVGGAEGPDQAVATPDTSVTESGPTSRSETPPPDGELGGVGDTVASGRPVRTAVVNAAAISEAQADILNRFDSLQPDKKRPAGKARRGTGKYKTLNEGQRLPRAQKQVMHSTV